MTSKLTPLDIQRLAYSRFLYDEGVVYSLRPAPLSSTAVLSFHDAVENFLGLAAQFLGVEVSPKVQFIEYWGQLKPTVLPGKGAMNTLNSVRVALKHHGVFPSAQTVEQSRASVLNFFTAATPMVFGIEFDAISMTGLVTQEETAQLLRDAQTHADEGDWVHAMAGLRLALEALLERYARPRELRHVDSPFAFGPRINSRRLHELERGTMAEQEMGKAVEVAVATQRAIQVVSLGIDFPSYIRFTWLTPRVDAYGDGSRRYYPTAQEEAVTGQDYSWALNFVIESALQASRADEVLELVSTRATHNWNSQFDRTSQERFVMRSWEGPAT
ncbi:hypothetical protein HYE82_08635 [Streptomyces sp. BR123]|uniref:hypothetical protein n=1 Tax=Streptomyces sp. BR123 TaxID=2749828 RepID=UPI0015C48D3B|nr:hypothetical protein [Streptomyces sp. BR123]NXY94457.1 hypothetical protein [Streptomyces sp. BR123]